MMLQWVLQQRLLLEWTGVYVCSQKNDDVDWDWVVKEQFSVYNILVDGQPREPREFLKKGPGKVCARATFFFWVLDFGGQSLMQVLPRQFFCVQGSKFRKLKK